ncbi:MAG: hypothetical protein FVQ77_12090 [Cytophagales bacterium]|nr:hypothetical protein [Cytophagales bacterium]
MKPLITRITLINNYTNLICVIRVIRGFIHYFYSSSVVGHSVVCHKFFSNKTGYLTRLPLFMPVHGGQVTENR